MSFTVHGLEVGTDEPQHGGELMLRNETKHSIAALLRVMLVSMKSNPDTSKFPKGLFSVSPFKLYLWLELCLQPPIKLLGEDIPVSRNAYRTLAIAEPMKKKETHRNGQRD